MFSRISRAAHVKARLVVVQDAHPGAWTDGDKVFMTTGLVDSLPEDQVAAAVGHELGHIIGRHIPNTREAVEQLRREIYGGGERLAGLQGLCARAVIEASIIVARQHRSRRDEFEADAMGEALARRAGYGKGRMAEVVDQIASTHQTGNILDSHPTTPNRIAKLTQGGKRKLRIRIVRKSY